ncbi:hypothetical protein DPMN_021775 [Dreissena polymorpha]|uniref:Uncharacterized protein n=1 Tax=Dreissena polymorpha TaxID=45954 RepID=A0A9D4SC17_DREPO|nr:hypothetical protein DPMN_021775 [Dreissena polymorpha]
MDVSCSEFTAKSLLPICVNKDVLLLCVHNQVITAFLCQHGCIVLCVYSQVITAFLCQHGCIVLWVFTA